MRLSEIMSRDVKTISSIELAEAAYEKMLQNHIHHLIVMDGNILIGVVSDTEASNTPINPNINLKGLMVRDIMEDNFVTAEPDTTVREAANLMRGRSISCLPVLDNGKLVGIVTATDLLELLGRGTERVTADVKKRPVSREHPGSKPASFNPSLNP